MKTKIRVFFTLFIMFLFTPVSLLCEKGKPILFPNLYKSKPGVPSPYTFGKVGDHLYAEYITIQMPKGYAVVDVTQEEGEIYSCMHSLWGKGQQLWIDAPDFPTLGKTGLHSEVELDNKKYITGRKIELINYLAKPDRFSHSGFIGTSEDIISVLIRDNKTVKTLGLKHSDLAKPLFHIWNIIQGNYIRGRWARDISIFYNGSEVILNAEGGKGYQESIFHDEIEGRWNIKIHRDLPSEEIDLIKKKFPAFSNEKMKRLTEKLSSIMISEMNPFYIQRYGFYEGHTNFRADPIAISLIFGFKSLREVVKLFGKDLCRQMCSGS